MLSSLFMAAFAAQVADDGFSHRYLREVKAE